MIYIYITGFLCTQFPKIHQIQAESVITHKNFKFKVKLQLLMQQVRLGTTT